MAKLSIKELILRSMSVMICRVASIGLQWFSQRVTTTLLKGVNLNFRAWIQGLVKGVP